MVAASHSFNITAGTGPGPADLFIFVAALIDGNEREKRRRKWRREFNHRAARGLHPVPPWPKP